MFMNEAFVTVRCVEKIEAFGHFLQIASLGFANFAHVADLGGFSSVGYVVCLTDLGLFNRPFRKKCPKWSSFSLKSLVLA